MRTLTVILNLLIYPPSSPFSPAILNVKFLAYNRKHRKSPKLLDINDPYTILDAGFLPNHSIFFVTHGFLEFGGAPWIKKMIEELMIHDKHATVIAIDWRGGSSPPFYQGGWSLKPECVNLIEYF
jgi:Lipase